MTTLIGVGIAQVVTDALDLYRHVHGGRWSAAVTLTEDRFADPAGARAALEALAVTTGTVAAEQWPAVTGTADSVTFPGPVVDLRAALDLYVRVLLGQFSELAWSTGHPELGDACAAVRANFQREGAWPALAGGSWSVAGARAPREAQVAYDAWKLLGGGVLDRPLLTGEVSLG